jgi:hypothetical protein
MASEIAGAVKSFFDFLKIAFSSNRKMPSDAIIDRINIRLIGKELVKKKYSVDCFFLVLVHNGGGKLRPDNFIYWSIIDGWYNEELMKGFDHEKYILVNTETEFLLLARRIYENKGVGVRVDQMEKSKLKTSFQYERLKYIRFFYLKQDKRAQWFIMVGTTAENETLDSLGAEAEIFSAVNSVKNIIKDY